MSLHILFVHEQKFKKDNLRFEASVSWDCFLLCAATTRLQLHAAVVFSPVRPPIVVFTHLIVCRSKEMRCSVSSVEVLHMVTELFLWQFDFVQIFRPVLILCMTLLILYCTKMMVDGERERSVIRDSVSNPVLTTANWISSLTCCALVVSCSLGGRRLTCHTVSLILHPVHSLHSLLCRLYPHPPSDPAFNWAQLAQNTTK